MTSFKKLKILYILCLHISRIFYHFTQASQQFFVQSSFNCSIQSTWFEMKCCDYIYTYIYIYIYMR